MTENELHALVDGRLAPSRRAEVERWLLSHPEAAAQVDGWIAQRRLIDRLEADVLDEPVPARLVGALDAWPAGPGPRSGSPASRGRAASLRARLSGWWPRPATVAFAIALTAIAWMAGWWSHAQWSAQTPGSRVTVARDATPGFVGDARRAHAVFVPEVRHPVEVEAEQQAHLVQWLSKRLGRALRVPKLQDEGFVLLGGRLLPAAGAVGAQFMFQGTGGERLTLHITALDNAPGTSETAFRIVDEAGVSSFYWIDGAYGYTVTAPLGRDRMLAIARTVHEQICD